MTVSNGMHNATPIPHNALFAIIRQPSHMSPAQLYVKLWRIMKRQNSCLDLGALPSAWKGAWPRVLCARQWLLDNRRSPCRSFLTPRFIMRGLTIRAAPDGSSAAPCPEREVLGARTTPMTNITSSLNPVSHTPPTSSISMAVVGLEETTVAACAMIPPAAPASEMGFHSTLSFPTMWEQGHRGMYCSTENGSNVNPILRQEKRSALGMPLSRICATTIPFRCDPHSSTVSCRRAGDDCAFLLVAMKSCCTKRIWKQTQS